MTDKLQLNQHRRKFSQAFNHFIRGNGVPKGYKYTDWLDDMPVVPRFESQPFEIDGIDYKLIKVMHKGEWSKRAKLMTPMNGDYEDGER